MLSLHSAAYKKIEIEFRCLVLPQENDRAGRDIKAEDLQRRLPASSLMKGSRAPQKIPLAANPSIEIARKFCRLGAALGLFDAP